MIYKFFRSDAYTQSKGKWALAACAPAVGEGRALRAGFLSQNGKTPTIFRAACFNLVLMKGHCPWSLKPLLYPKPVKDKDFASVLILGLQI